MEAYSLSGKEEDYQKPLAVSSISQKRVSVRSKQKSRWEGCEQTTNSVFTQTDWADLFRLLDSVVGEQTL